MAGRSSERHRRATTAEVELWRATLRDVRPLRGRKRSAHPTTPIAADLPSDAQAPPLPAERRGRAVLAPGDGLDRRTAERLRRGQLPIEARLDLHGMRQDEAHDALAAFLARVSSRGFRCVLIITGKGLRRLDDAEWRIEASGVLKSAVPRWLAEPVQRARILAVAEAQPKHGGSGALYVLLRRQREGR
jgi:DNA-nicking Smr family endonuclease